MDQSVVKSALFFNPRDMRDELTGLWRESSDAQLRQKVLTRLKDLKHTAREQAYGVLKENHDGRRCAQSLSDFQDELIRLIYEFTIHHVYRAKNPSAAERMTIVATGGYGRGLLAPSSDVDLLFLLPYKQTAWGESVVEYILYFLWDLGFKVGHATRTVEQCVRLARSDMTIRTALLDARSILGDAGLFRQLCNRLADGVIRGTYREFIAAKLGERDQRHRRTGVSRYKVEPNIKDGKGGMRDLHTLYWLAIYRNPAGGLTGSGIFSKTESALYHRCEDFLWTVRCHLHFLAGKAEEHLTFDVQPILAERLRYKERHGLLAVERFMKHYFLVAKDVGDLTRVVSAVLEMRQLKTAPALSSLLSRLSWRRRVKLTALSDFRIGNGRITVKQTDVFKTDPVNLIRLFALAEKHNVQLHPEAIRLVRASLRLIGDKLRADPEANRLFLEILTSKTGSEASLRAMNEAGVLGRFIPDFGRVVSMMHFNMYHHYTVDEHLIRAVGILAEIERGEHGGELPLSTGIIQNIQDRRALYLAVFLHDIAKGRDIDHSIAGAQVAYELGSRFGLSNSEIETVAWLVENHLVMSQFAQSRDLSDPKTISDFAQIVQSPERLKLLVILTAADIRAVGPGVWNGWKGQLLRALYYETEPVLAGGHTTVTRDIQLREAQHRLREALAGWPEDEVTRFIDRHYPAYWLRTDLRRQIEHASLIRRAADERLPFVYDIKTDAFRSSTELTLFTTDHPRLLATFAGACAAAGANITGAHISTTRDGMALDTLVLQPAFKDEREELARAGKIAATIGELLDGKRSLDKLLSRKRKPKGQLGAFSVPPRVIIDNSLSEQHTVIEINGLDRPGLLYDLTSTLADSNLDISSAHIATFGEKAVDVFYVTDQSRRKIKWDHLKRRIHERLQKALEGGGA